MDSLCRINQATVVESDTSGQVGSESWSEQDGRTVPSFVGEHLLTDVGRGSGGARHCRH